MAAKYIDSYRDVIKFHLFLRGAPFNKWDFPSFVFICIVVVVVVVFILSQVARVQKLLIVQSQAWFWSICRIQTAEVKLQI